MKRGSSMALAIASALAISVGGLGAGRVGGSVERSRSRSPRKRGPGRTHAQGKGAKRIPLAAPDHAIDCELNDHPAVLAKMMRAGVKPTCNCFRNPSPVRHLARANSMRRHIPEPTQE